MDKRHKSQTGKYIQGLHNAEQATMVTLASTSNVLCAIKELDYPCRGQGSISYETYHHQRPLGTKRGIRALSEFLEKGGVFTREGDTRPSWEDGPDPTEEGETRQNKRHRAHHPNIIYRIPYNT